MESLGSDFGGPTEVRTPLRADIRGAVEWLNENGDQIASVAFSVPGSVAAGDTKTFLESGPTPRSTASRSLASRCCNSHSSQAPPAPPRLARGPPVTPWRRIRPRFPYLPEGGRLLAAGRAGGLAAEADRHQRESDFQTAGAVERGARAKPRP